MKGRALGEADHAEPDVEVGSVGGDVAAEGRAAVAGKGVPRAAAQPACFVRTL